MNTHKIASRISLIVIVALLSACNGNLGGKSIETATATLIPTKKTTPSPLPTYTNTPTITPSPTPIGGGNGIFLFTLNTYQEQPPSLGGIYTVRTDGSNLHPLLSYVELESLIGEYQWLTYYSNNGDGFLLADAALYSVTPDWKITNKITNSVAYLRRPFISFSPDGKQILYTESNNSIFVTNLDGSETKRIANIDVADLWWSADGENIYYRPRTNIGYDFGIANADGSGSHKLELSFLMDYTPNEGTPLPEGINSMSYLLSFDSFSLSPDRNKIAFSWQDLLFLTDATDKEFKNPRLLTKIPNQADSIYWSPDGNYLLMGTFIIDLLSGSSPLGDSILVDISKGRIEATFPPEEFGNILCGFSPDGKYFVFEFRNYHTMESGIRLVKLDDKSTIEVVNLDGWVECPVWP